MYIDVQDRDTSKNIYQWADRQIYIITLLLKKQFKRDRDGQMKREFVGRERYEDKQLRRETERQKNEEKLKEGERE